MEFQDAISKSFALKETRQMIAADHEGPNELLEPDALGYAVRSDCPETSLNIIFCFLQQPRAQVAIDLDRRQLQLFRRNLAEVRSTFRPEDLLRQPLCQGLIVLLNHADQFQVQHLPPSLSPV